MQNTTFFFLKNLIVPILFSTFIILSISGCDGDTISNTTNNFSKEDLADIIVDKVSEEIDDYIACSSFSQFDVDTEKLKEMIMSPGAVNLEDLLTEPSTIAWATQYLGGTLEGGIIIIRNVLYFMEEGHTPSLLTNGWSGLNCDDSITLACVTGYATSTVLCTDSIPTSIKFEFNDCVRSGNVYSGTVSMQSVPGDAPAVKIGFEDYKYSADGEITGLVEFNINSGTALEIALQAEQELQIISYGGPSEGAPSCASLLGITTMGLSLQETENTLTVEGRRETMDGIYALKTIQSHLWWPSENNCLCPGLNGGVEFDFPNPLGQEGETVTARVIFGAPQEEHLCSHATVTMLDWPSDCSFAENASSDCGKLSTERILSLTLSSLCVPVE
jgi:hypothetical protein